MNKESNASKAIKGMSSQAFVTIVLGVVELISFSIMSRLLTQEDFGYYAAITAITAVFASFSETGIGSAIVQQKDLTQRFLNNAFTLSLLFGIFISSLLFALAGPLSHAVADESMKVPLRLISGTLLINCLISVNTSILHRRLEFLRLGSIRLFALVVTTLVAIFLAYKGYGYYAILTKAILTSVITFILSLYYCKTHFSLALDRKTFKTIFSFSGWLMASVVLRNLAHQIDRLMMPRLLSITSLGAYNRPKDFIEQISSRVSGIFDSALFPVLSGIQGNRQSLNSAFRRSLYALNLSSLLLAIAIMFNSGILIRIFLGEQWLQLRPIMVVIAISLPFNFNGRLADCFLRSLAMTKQQFFFRILEITLNIVSVIIGYRWGTLGVAVSIVMANALTKILKILYIGVKVDMMPRQTLARLFSSGRFLMFFLPLIILAFYLPSSWEGDVIMAGVFIAVAGLIFLLMPQLIGKEYQDEMYGRIVGYIKCKIHK